MEAYEEMKNAVLKLDESRFLMNKLMGPDGALTQNERRKYLASNLPEHDKLLSNIGGRGQAKITNHPTRQGSKLGLL